MQPTQSVQHAFAKVPIADINRSSFNRSHSVKTTFDAGWLIPFFTDLAYPGDTFNINPSFLIRLNTPLKPIMDEMYVDVHWFAIPCRLLWSNWNKFMGERLNPGDSIDFVIPKFTSPVGGVAVGSLHAYMGIRPEFAGITFSALYARAYNLTYNTWYRDQNLINSAVVDLTDAAGNIADYVLRRRGKRHDYFTTCLPWAQKIAPVTMPLGTSAPVVLDAGSMGTNQIVRKASDHTLFGAGGPFNVLDLGSGGVPAGALVSGGGAPAPAVIDPNGTLVANLASATAATINAIRYAITLQQFLETDARGGTRLPEMIHSHFGVTNPDFRMQRPEYLGGGTIPVIVHPIAQTAPQAAGTPLGNIGAFGTAISSNGLGFIQSFSEHCIVLGILSARAAYSYSQGVERRWNYSTRFDHYWPVFAHIGEQPVLNREIYADGGAGDTGTFGFQEAWAEMRYKPSLLTGLMRTGIAGSLGDAYTLAEHFAVVPTLNQAFIEENPPVDRVIAVPSEPHFIMDSYISFNAVRPLPVFSTPGLRVL